MAYKITNTVNGKVYIGSTINFSKRHKEHERLLRNNGHINSHLQSAWNKYGASAFEFAIVEKCVPKLLLTREDFWIIHYDSLNRQYGYNLTTAERHVHSLETRNKISKALTGKPHKGHKLTIEHICRIREGYQKWSNNPVRHKQTKETRRKMSEAHKGKKYRLGFKMSEETKQLMRGRKLSEETKRKMSESHKRRLVNTIAP